MPLISLLVGILNPPELTENFLCWLANDLKNDDVELVIVCDGDSNVRTHRLLRDAERTASNIRVIFQENSTGYGSANNLAAREAEGEILVFLNSDTFPTKGAVRALADLVKSDEQVGVAQGLLIYPHNLRVQSTGHVFGPYFNQHALAGRSIGAPIVRRAADRQALTGAFYAVRRTHFIANNGFDEFYLNAFEAMEFALKMHLKGFRCLYRPEAIAYHIQGGARRHFPMDESQQIARFWSKWTSVIRQDLDDLLGQQISKAYEQQNYLIVNASINRCWMRTLDKLHLRGDDVATLAGSEKYSLHEHLVPAIHRSTSPILFLTDRFAQIGENLLWFSSRRDMNDLILDCHGNVITMAELLSPSPQAVIYP